MPGEASGDARLPSAGGDFEDCLFAQTSFGFARPIRSIESSLRSREDGNLEASLLKQGAERTSADARLASPGGRENYRGCGWRVGGRTDHRNWSAVGRGNLLFVPVQGSVPRSWSRIHPPGELDK
ncbi:hypothetical protein RJ60_04140 [Mesotoga sp. B105.6.4]|nr:hypothetical protein RJ60_04140 [Mesotoga sp. B105.6.4]